MADLQIDELLNHPVVKRMVEVEAREALERYLKGWGAVISFGVAVVAIAGGILGWSLKSELGDLQASVGRQSAAVDHVKVQAENLERGFAAKQNELTFLTAAIELKTWKLDERVDQVSSVARTLDGDGRKMLREIDAQTVKIVRSAEAASETQARATEELAAIRTVAGQATTARDAILNDHDKIESAGADIERHRRVFQNAPLDYVTLQSGLDSVPVELPRSNGKTKFIVWFHPDHVRSRGFPLKYFVVERELSVQRGLPIDPQKEQILRGEVTVQKVSSGREWHLMAQTSNEYQFSPDLIVSSLGVRNYASVRIAATDQLLAPPVVTVAATSAP